MSNIAGDQQSTVPRQSFFHSFRKAFAIGTIWWIGVSLVASAHNHSRPAGFIFGELLVPTIIAATIAGAAGRLVRTRMAWLVIATIFLVAWFVIRLALMAPHLME